jgi:hypothetical protein
VELGGGACAQLGQRRVRCGARDRRDVDGTQAPDLSAAAPSSPVDTGRVKFPWSHCTDGCWL